MPVHVWPIPAKPKEQQQTTFTALLKDLTSLLVKSADTKLVQSEESIPVELDI